MPQDGGVADDEVLARPRILLCVLLRVSRVNDGYAPFTRVTSDRLDDPSWPPVRDVDETASHDSGGATA
jgi:hypothetical protein